MLFNSQITNSNNNFDIYIGVENISNYVQENPIISSETPNFLAAFFTESTNVSALVIRSRVDKISRIMLMPIPSEIIVKGIIATIRTIDDWIDKSLKPDTTNRSSMLFGQSFA